MTATNVQVVLLADEPGSRVGLELHRQVALRLDGEDVDVVGLKLSSERERKRLIESWSGSHEIDREFLSRTLSAAAVAAREERESALAEQLGKACLEDCGDDCHVRKPSQASMLVELTEGMELFHGPGQDGEAFGVIDVRDHKETWALGSKGFRRWLCHQFYCRELKAPNAQALVDAMNVIVGKALFSSPERATHVRLAESDGCIYLDLADAEWRAVRIAPDGWEVVSDPPVRFIRPDGMLPLAAPVHGGSIDELRTFVNVPDDDSWILLLAWIIAALRPRGPYPVLCVAGEKGAAKSSLCRFVRKLIDPNRSPLRRPPKGDRDVMIAATNSWVFCLDNLSCLSGSLSDVICTLATGGGFATRALYSDDAEKLFDVVRPVMLNGINNVATRSDLGDRTVMIDIPRFADGALRTEEDLKRDFEEARPQILGALLDVLAGGLRRLDAVKIDRLPRMADFALWAVACEPGLGIPEGSFLRAYRANRQAGRHASIEAVAIGPAILAFMRDRQTWVGKAKELLKELSDDRYVSEVIRKSREWPKSGSALSRKLKEIASDLTEMGVLWEPPAETDKTRLHRLESTLEMPPKPPKPPDSLEMPPKPPGMPPEENGPDGIVSDDLGGMGGMGGILPPHSGTGGNDDPMPPEAAPF